MDAEQKFIGESRYELDKNFLDALTNVPIQISMKVARYIDECYNQISKGEKKKQVYGGVIHCDNEAVFFSVEVFHYPPIVKYNDLSDIGSYSFDKYNYKPILLGFKVISVDEYLDFILIKSYLKNE